MMDQKDHDPVAHSFNLGPDGFTASAKFVLAQGDWENAQNYGVAVASVATVDIPFKDVRSLVEDIQSQAYKWKNSTYPQCVVSLASAVVDYANKAAVYYSALAKVLEKLGEDPTNTGLLEQFDAILEVLNKIPSEQKAAASKAEVSVENFEANAAGAQKQLGVVFSDYVTIYLEGQSGAKSPILPAGLSQPVAALRSAWRQLGEVLASLKSWVDKNAAIGAHFEADISSDSAVQAWAIAGEEANNWRLGAYTT